MQKEGRLLLGSVLYKYSSLQLLQCREKLKPKVRKIATEKGKGKGVGGLVRLLTGP